MVTIDAPGAGTVPGADQGTIPESIDIEGTIAGQYEDANDVFHCFLRYQDDLIIDFDAPHAGTGQNQGSLAVDINTEGTIAGYAIDDNNVLHGFVRSPLGTFTSFDAPENSDWQWSLSRSYQKVGDVLLVQGDLESALENYREEFTIIQRLVSQDPTNAEWQTAAAWNRYCLARILIRIKQGDRGEAKRLLLEGCDIMAHLEHQSGFDAKAQDTLNKLNEIATALGRQRGMVGACGFRKSDINSWVDSAQFLRSGGPAGAAHLTL
jgi:hypothetical protein